MIWGKTFEQQGQQARTPHRWFAWRPVWLEDGRWAWLQWVTRRSVDDHFDDSWAYTAP